MPLPEPPERADPGIDWPCAQLTIGADFGIAGGQLYAPGLPPGTHNVWCMPVDAEAPIARLRAALEQSRQQLRLMQCLYESDLRDFGAERVSQLRMAIDAGTEALQLSGFCGTQAAEATAAPSAANHEGTNMDSITITKAQLQAAMLRWEVAARAGETMSHDEAMALPAEEVAAGGTERLWADLAAVTNA
jgi:hypothetical protein